MARQELLIPDSGFKLPNTRDFTTEDGESWKAALTKIEANFVELFAREDLSAYVQDDGSLGVSTAEQGASGSFQPIWADLNLAAAAGSDDGADPSFLAPFMGNILSDVEVAGEGNYLAGVIGAFSVPTNGSDYPAAALMGIIMDGSTGADAAVLAVIDGSDPSAETRAGAAFGVAVVNNNEDSGVDYGLDLFATPNAHISDGPPETNDGPQGLNIAKAQIRMSDETCILTGSGAPVDYTDGDPVATGEGYAGPGSLYIRTNGTIFINDGSKAQPTWNELTKV